jgi:hypothetical protein
LQSNKVIVFGQISLIKNKRRKKGASNILIIWNKKKIIRSEKKFTNLKLGTKMAYKIRQYGEKDGQKMMKAIIAQQKSYNNEQERKRKKQKK